MKKVDETKLRVTFEPYERYEHAGIKFANVSGTDRVDALCNMLNHLDMYLEGEEAKERKMTAEQIIQELEEQNGDGCDFIIRIEDITTDEILMDYSGSYEEECW